MNEPFIMTRHLYFALISLLLLSRSALAIDVGGIAPAFELPTQAAAPLKLEQFKGKVIYLDFWASWCGPCRASFPWMNQMQSRYGQQGLQVVGINLDAKQTDADKFLAQVPASFQVAFDAKGTTPRTYGVKGMPTSLLIDRDGKVLYKHTGFHPDNRDELEAHIKQAIGVGS